MSSNQEGKKDEEPRRKPGATGESSTSQQQQNRFAYGSSDSDDSAWDHGEIDYDDPEEGEMLITGGHHQQQQTEGSNSSNTNHQITQEPDSSTQAKQQIANNSSSSKHTSSNGEVDFDSLQSGEFLITNNANNHDQADEQPKHKSSSNSQERKQSGQSDSTGTSYYCIPGKGGKLMTRQEIKMMSEFMSTATSPSYRGDTSDETGYDPASSATRSPNDDSRSSKYTPDLSSNHTTVSDILRDETSVGECVDDSSVSVQDAVSNVSAFVSESAHSSPKSTIDASGGGNITMSTPCKDQPPIAQDANNTNDNNTLQAAYDRQSRIIQLLKDQIRIQNKNSLEKTAVIDDANIKIGQLQHQVAELQRQKGGYLREITEMQGEIRELARENQQLKHQARSDNSINTDNADNSNVSDNTESSKSRKRSADPADTDGGPAPKRVHMTETGDATTEEPQTEEPPMEQDEPMEVDAEGGIDDVTMADNDGGDGRNDDNNDGVHLMMGPPGPPPNFGEPPLDDRADPFWIRLTRQLHNTYGDGHSTDHLPEDDGKCTIDGDGKINREFNCLATGCPRVFSTAWGRRTHMLRNHPLQCSLCGFYLGSASKKSRHLHSSAKTPAGFFVCVGKALRYDDSRRHKLED